MDHVAPRPGRSAGLEPVDLAAEAVEREVAAPGRIVPLWTFAVAAGAAAAGSAVMLRREWASRH